MDKLKKLYQQLEKLKTDEEKIDQLVLIANRFMYVDLDRFAAALDEMKQLSEKTHNELGMYHYHYGMGKLLTKRMEYTGALQSFAAARDIAEHVGNQRFIATNLYCFSIVNVNLGNFQEAYQQAGESVKMFKKLMGEELNLSVAYCYLGISSECLGKYEEAEAAFEKSLAIMPNDSEPGTLTGMMVNYAVFKVKLKQYDKALELYVNALHIMEQSNNKIGIAQTLVNIGELYFFMGDINNALKYCVNGLKFLKHVDNKKALIKVYLCLAEIYMALGGLTEAEQKLTLAAELIQTISMPAAECHLAGAKGELYYKSGMFDQAKEWLLKANEIAEAKGFLELKEKYQPLMQKVLAAEK